MDDGSAGSAALTTAVRALVEQGPPGASLPSTRELQRRFRVSPVTAGRVLAALQAQGLVEITPGRGSVVARRVDRPVADLAWQPAALGVRDTLPDEAAALYRVVDPGLIDLATAYLDPDLQPTGLLAAAAARAARRSGAWDRLPVQGLRDLRTLLAAAVSPHHTADDVLVTSGGQAALALCFRALASPGDTLLVEATTYPGALAAARSAGLIVVPVPSDGEGVRDLGAALARTGARLVYLQPRNANPTGVATSPARRAEVLRALHVHGALAVEDDWVAGLDLDGPTHEPLAAADPDGHVVHVSSLSKHVAPGLRIAGVTARGAVPQRLRRARLADDLFLAPVLQHTAVELLTSPGWPRHLASTRRQLAVRRDVLHAALAGAGFPATPRPVGGVHLWQPLPPGTDEAALVAAARAAGVAVSPGSVYAAGEATAPHLRLTYCRVGPAQLQDAAQRLGALLDPRVDAAGLTC